MLQVPVYHDWMHRNAGNQAPFFAARTGLSPVLLHFLSDAGRRIFDTTRFSDEYCRYGEFTGTMAGITCADRVKHAHYADFDFLEVVAEGGR